MNSSFRRLSACTFILALMGSLLASAASVEPPPLAKKLSAKEKAAAIATYESLIAKAEPVQVGDTEEELTRRLGPPEGILSFGNKKRLGYGKGHVIIQDGRISSISGIPEEQLKAPDLETFTAYQEARGMVRYMGRWMPVEESLDAYEKALADLERSEQRIQSGKKDLARRKVELARSSSLVDIRQGGAEISVQDLVVPGKVTVVDFYADWCGPCKKMAPYIAKFAEHPEVAVRKVDIVNWSSPVARQWGLRSIPNIRVYDRSGRAVGKPTSDLREVAKYVESAF